MPLLIRLPSLICLVFHPVRAKHESPPLCEARRVCGTLWCSVAIGSRMVAESRAAFLGGAEPGKLQMKLGSDQLKEAPQGSIWALEKHKKDYAL